MLHLAAEKERGIITGMRHLGRSAINQAFEDLSYHRYTPEISRRIRRDADHFFDPNNPGSSLPILAQWAELDLDMIYSKARKIQDGRHRL